MGDCQFHRTQPIHGRAGLYILPFDAVHLRGSDDPGGYHQRLGDMVIPQQPLQPRVVGVIGQDVGCS